MRRHPGLQRFSREHHRAQILWDNPDKQLDSTVAGEKRVEASYLSDWSSVNVPDTLSQSHQWRRSSEALRYGSIHKDVCCE